LVVINHRHFDIYVGYWVVCESAATDKLGHHNGILPVAITVLLCMRACISAKMLFHWTLSFIFCLSTLALFQAEPAQNFTHLVYKDCGDENSIIYFEYLDAQPNPLPFPGRMRLLLRANVSRSPPDRVNVRLFLRKYLIKSGWVRLPCLSGFGSCLYSDLPVCLLTSDLFGCPVEPMYYNINDSFMLSSVDFAPRIAPGDYQILMTVYDSETKQQRLACLAVQFSLAKSEHP
ncbi:hypothetical protein T4A_11651, partial [Trichinella pseudospiralis]